MIHTFHRYLRQSLPWYNDWHDHPHHQHAHWSFFVIVSILIFSFISGLIPDIYSQNQTPFTIVAHAQTGPDCIDTAPPASTVPNMRSVVEDLANDMDITATTCDRWEFMDELVRRLRAGPGGTRWAYNGTRSNLDDPWHDGPAYYYGPGNAPRPGTTDIYEVFAIDAIRSVCAGPTDPTTAPQWLVADWPNHPRYNGDGTVNVAYLYPRNADGNASKPAKVLCTAATPTPTPVITVTPLPRYIYYAQPYSLQAGQTITIVGQNLAATVNFRNSSGISVQSTGTLNSDNSEVTAIVPSSLASGLFTVFVGPNPDSNAVELEVIGGTYDPGPTGGQIPIISSLNPVVVTHGDVLEIMGQFLTPVVQFIDVNGITTTVTGSVNANYGITTVYIPNSLAPSIYTVAIVSSYGTGVSADVLTVIETETPITPTGFSPQATPSATSFQDLITNAFNYSLIMVGIAVFIMIMWGGFLWLTSAANPANIGSAKRYITNAILGAVLLVSAYVILYTINPELVGGGFNLPGIEAPIIPGREGTVTPNTGCSASQQPASVLLSNLGVSNFSNSADCGGSNHALQNIQAMAGGSCPSVCSSSCDCVTGGTSGNITVDPVILATLNELRVTRGVFFRVTSFTTGEHSTFSYHYGGRGVDIVLNDRNSVVWGSIRAWLESRGGTAICEIGGRVIPNCDNFSGGAHIHWQR